MAATNPKEQAGIGGDRFKQVNNTYGHPFGDQVLTVAGRALTLQVEPFARGG